jgi:hypothetical protein
VQGFQLGFATQLLVVGLGVTFFTVERRKYLRMSSEIGNN